MANYADWAKQVACELLEPLGRRWMHVQSVALLAHRVAALVDDPDTLVAAAYLHDLGYAPAIALTGFHPLDGARFVRDQGHPEIAFLIAHHTGARHEAPLRGMDDFQVEFPFRNSLMQRALTYCDLTIGPAGSATTVDERIVEIVDRYGSEHVVSRAIRLGYPEFKEIEDEINALLILSGSSAQTR